MVALGWAKDPNAAAETLIGSEGATAARHGLRGFPPSEQSKD
jgi:hypothetical protein